MPDLKTYHLPLALPVLLPQHTGLRGGLSQISVLTSFGLPLVIVAMMFSPALIGLLQWIIRMVSPSKAT